MQISNPSSEIQPPIDVPTVTTAILADWILPYSQFADNEIVRGPCLDYDSWEILVYSLETATIGLNLVSTGDYEDLILTIDFV